MRELRAEMTELRWLERIVRGSGKLNMINFSLRSADACSCIWFDYTNSVSLSPSLLMPLSVYIQQAPRQCLLVQQYPGQLIIKIFTSAKLTCLHFFFFCDTAPIFSKDKPEQGWHLGCTENKNQVRKIEKKKKKKKHWCASVCQTTNIVLGGAESTKEQQRHTRMWVKHTREVWMNLKELLLL